MNFKPPWNQEIVLLAKDPEGLCRVMPSPSLSQSLDTLAGPLPVPLPAWPTTGSMPGISLLLLRWRHSAQGLTGPGEKSQIKLLWPDQRWHDNFRNLFVGIEHLRLRPLNGPSGLIQIAFRICLNHCVSSVPGPVVQASRFGGWAGLGRGLCWGLRVTRSLAIFSRSAAKVPSLCLAWNPKDIFPAQSQPLLMSWDLLLRTRFLPPTLCPLSAYTSDLVTESWSRLPPGRSSWLLPLLRTHGPSGIFWSTSLIGLMPRYPGTRVLLRSVGLGLAPRSNMIPSNLLYTTSRVTF